ncbi:probable 39S ribosomal protein L49, mitochondrial [Chelonus insularis]|uniref:probable 39S ribosomal protein L49, mitochondrial n=1 Tax=Chelonus insularis TaxID=460826 RepID=UPI0015884543|nr:probable 39S ribosomal protein L49, mitochondrial [Chelonus insularis]
MREREGRRARAHQWRTPEPFDLLKMAALRIFARTVISANKELHRINVTNIHSILPIVQINERWISFFKPPKYDPNTIYTDFEKVENPKEWPYVEWYLKSHFIPKPKNEENLPSGWVPPKEGAKKLPYFVQRSKNFMLPVYLVRKNRGLRRLTIIKKIEGDILRLEAELKPHLEKLAAKEIGCQISEPGGVIKFRGDHVSRVKEWLISKGF